MSHSSSQLELEALFDGIKQKGLIGGFMETAISEIYAPWILKPGNVAIDIGAHKGLHTVPMAGCVTGSGRILAFEACPDLCRELSAICHQLPQVEVINKAVGQRSLPSVTFYKNVAFPGQSTIIHGYGKNFTEKDALTIPCTSLDDIQQQSHKRKLGFIKIDAEGAELDILKGANELLRIHSPLIAAEISIYKFRTALGEFERVLGDINYSAYTLSGIKLTRSLLSSNFSSPSYTLMLARNDHWTADFCSDSKKMERQVRRIAERWMDRPSVPVR